MSGRSSLRAASLMPARSLSLATELSPKGLGAVGIEKDWVGSGIGRVELRLSWVTGSSND